MATRSHSRPSKGSSRNRRNNAPAFNSNALMYNLRVDPQQWVHALRLGVHGFNELMRIRRSEIASRDARSRYHWNGARYRDESVAQLEGLNLSGMDLRGYDLAGANLAGANLSGADLRGADLDRACLAKTNLRDTNMSGLRLFHVDFTDAQLVYTDMRDVCITGELTGGERGWQKWQDVLMDGAKFSDCVISGWRAQIIAPDRGISFVRCRLRHHTTFVGESGAGRWRSTVTHPVRISGAINKLVLDRTRVHSLQLSVADPGCDLVCDQSVYLWINASGISSVEIRNETLRDHGGRIAMSGKPHKVIAPRWERFEASGLAGSGMVLECAPQRVIEERDSPMESGPVKYLREWERGRGRALELAASGYPVY